MSRAYPYTPSNLSFARSIMITDPLFFNVIVEHGHEKKTPLHVSLHEGRGTQNDPSGNGKQPADREVANILFYEAAKLDDNAIAMQVEFDMSGVDLKHAIHSCVSGAKNGNVENAISFRKLLEQFIGKAQHSEDLVDVAQRYARNIANGRFLWRNRNLASEIETKVYGTSKAGIPHKTPIASFFSLTVPMKHFEQFSQGEKDVANVLLGLWRGTATENFGLHIVSQVKFGVRGAIDVYPSQNMVIDKQKNSPSRSLYTKPLPGVNEKRNTSAGPIILGQAAMTSVKAGNALRTIDTWYDPSANRPIAVEPEGACLDDNKHYRPDNGNTHARSAFAIFRDIANLQINTSDSKFAIAAIIRGGVYGSPEEKSGAKKSSKRGSNGESETGDGAGD